MKDQITKLKIMVWFFIMKNYGEKLFPLTMVFQDEIPDDRYLVFHHSCDTKKNQATYSMFLT
jgi:hypothetical protein